MAVWFYGMYNLAFIHTRQGHLREAHVLYQQAIQAESNISDDLLFSSSVIYIGLSNLYYEWNNLPLAIHYLEKAIMQGKRMEDLKVLPIAYMLMANIKHTLGDEIGVSTAVESSNQALRTYNTLSLNLLVGSCKARLLLRQGKHKEAQLWAEQYAQFMMERPTHLYEAEHLTRIRFLMKDGQYATALTILHEHLAKAQRDETIGNIIEIKMLLALIYQAQNDRQQALQHLSHALSLAEPEGYIRTFVDEGEVMAILLADLLAARQSNPLPFPVSTEYIHHLLAAFRTPCSTENTQEAHASSPSTSGLTEPLSERELEILRLIARGLSNQDIMQRLVIAKSTLKTHINHIYSKLAVRNRAQAIVQARSLRLLDETFAS